MPTPMDADMPHSANALETLGEKSPAAPPSSSMVMWNRIINNGMLRLSGSHPRLFKAIVIRAILLVVALSCLTGYAQPFADRLMGPVIRYDQQYLQKTLKNMAGSLFLLSFPKGVMEVAQSFELEPSGATFKIGTVSVGEILEPYMHIIDDIWDFLVLSSYIVIGQIAVLKFAGIISIKFLLGFGLLLLVVQYRRNTLFGKIGWTLMMVFLMTYVVYPLIVGMAANTYEAHQAQTAIELSENLGILKEKSSDIDFSPYHLKESINSIPQVLGQGIKTTLDATYGLIVGILLMFVILPIFSLGTIYLICRQVMQYLDMAGGIDKLDSAGKRLMNKAASRRPTKLAVSRG